MKNLNDIELDYIRSIIEFFCREYPPHIKFDKYDNYKKSELISLISNQIVNRLVKTNLITDFTVRVNVHPMDEKRNCQIENILEDKNVVLSDNITVYYQRNREFLKFEYKL